MPLGELLDVHVLDADAAAIDRAQQRDDLAQARPLAAEQIIDKDFAVEIGLGKPVGAVVEFGVVGAPLDPSGSRSASRWPRTR